MGPLEKVLIKIRHQRLLKKQMWLWDAIRPAYDWIWACLHPKGVVRNMNQIDPIRLPVFYRHLMEEYEPDIWPAFMEDVEASEVVVDVGAFIGLYAVAAAKRLKGRGRVVAFEPNDKSRKSLKQLQKLNEVEDCLEIQSVLLSDTPGQMHFDDTRGSSSKIQKQSVVESAISVDATTLDLAFAQTSVDLLKIDVEGHEEQVLQGGRSLLSDPQRRPKKIYIEVHPFAWHIMGTTDRSLLALLKELGYIVKDVEGNSVTNITKWGEVIAHAQ